MAEYKVTYLTLDKKWAVNNTSKGLIRYESTHDTKKAAINKAKRLADSGDTIKIWKKNGQPDRAINV